jgi:hypothetical protein
LLGAGRSRRNKYAQNKSGTHCGNEVLEAVRSEQMFPAQSAGVDAMPMLHPTKAQLKDQ